MTSEKPTVLVVDDEHDLADLYGVWLEGTYQVRTAYGGPGALEIIDDDDVEVDVALIDRLMPQLSGDEVLETLREEGYDARVAMVTAVEPDFDIVEMGFDEYILKPVQREQLLEVVDSLVSRRSYDRQLQEFYALASKRATLQAQKTTSELKGNDVYAELTTRVEEVREDLADITDELSDRDFEVQLRQMSANG